MEPLDIMKALNIVSQLVESDEVGCVQKFSLQAFEKDSITALRVH